MSDPLRIPVIDISPLLEEGAGPAAAAETIEKVRAATQQVGFMYISGHGVPTDLMDRMKGISRRFFKLPLAEKQRISMLEGGKAWRGFFKVGDELTSGVADQKEGIYFGSELPAEHPLPLHGPNLWPSGELGAEMKEIVLDYIARMQQLGFILMQAVASSLNINPMFFGEAFADPTILFRIFNYPPHNPEYGQTSQAVGEHTDYGYLTILWQDSCGGLQVRGRAGQWIDAPYVENTFVINLGDALEHCTGGLLRATPHRVLQRAGAIGDRLSFPFFYDPNFKADMTSIVSLLTPEQREVAEANRKLAKDRWDKSDPSSFQGSYGAYLTTKVSKVFPGLAAASITSNS